MRLLAALVFAVAVAGCVGNPALDTTASGIGDSQSPAGGDQKGAGGDGETTNIGPIAISGSGWLFAVVAVAWIWRGKREAVKALDWRIGEDMGREEQWKLAMQNRACHANVEPEINKAVHRVKKKARTNKR